MRRLLAPFVALCLMVPATALAQDSDKQAERLFTEARTAMRKGDIDTACKKFIESFDISGALGPLLNLAECEEKRGRPATALARWKRGLQKLAEKPKDKRSGPVQDRITALEKVVPRVTIKLATNAPEGTRVRVDGEVVEMPSGPMPVDPGEHTVVVTAPDHQEKRYTVSVVELDRKELQVEPGPPLAEVKAIGAESGVGETGGVREAAGVREKAAVEPRSGGASGGGEETSGGMLRVTGFVVGGLGVGAIVSGGVTALLMMSKHSEVEELCGEDKTCPPGAFATAQEGRTLGLLNTLSLAAGAGCLVTSAVLLLASSGGEKKAETTTAVGVTPLPRGAGFVLRKSF